VGLGEFKTEIGADEGEVEALAVVGDEELETLDIASEVIEVLSVDVMMKANAIVDADGGDDVGWTAEAGGLDVEIGGDVAEGFEETPVLVFGEAVGEVGDVVMVEGVERFREVMLDDFGLARPEGFQPAIEDIVPGEDARFPEGAFGFKADARDVAEGVMKHVSARLRREVVRSGRGDRRIRV